MNSITRQYHFKKEKQQCPKCLNYFTKISMHQTKSPDCDQPKEKKVYVYDKSKYTKQKFDYTKYGKEYFTEAMRRYRQKKKQEEMIEFIYMLKNSDISVQ